MSMGQQMIKTQVKENRITILWDVLCASQLIDNNKQAIKQKVVISVPVFHICNSHIGNWVNNWTLYIKIEFNTNA